MKPIAVCLVAAVLASPAAAQPRPFTPSLSCAETTQIVRAVGAVVLSTSRTTYDRYVSDGRFCLRDETIDPAFVATADVPQCFVGYRCVDGHPDLFSR